VDSVEKLLEDENNALVADDIEELRPVLDLLRGSAAAKVPRMISCPPTWKSSS